MLSRILKALASARLAAWLIAVLVATLLVSFLVPQRGIFPDAQVDAFLADMPKLITWALQALQLDRVFTSTLFYLAAALLAVNLLVCTARRVPVRMRRSRPAFAGTVPAHAVRVSVPDHEFAVEAIEALGASATDDDDGCYYLRRGGAGFIGSVVLHAGLVLVLVAGVLTSLTTFRGEMVIAEGQTRGDMPEEYLAVSQVPSVGPAFGDFALTLDSMTFTYEEGTVVDAVASMRIHDAGGERVEQARVNYPLKAHGKSFLLQDAGHAVWLTVQDSDGVLVFDGFLNLLDATDAGYADSYPLGDEQLSVLSRPDSSVPVTDPLTEGLNLRSPVVGLALGDETSPGDRLWVRPGEPAVQLEGYTVAVHEVRIWNRFMVRADGGRYLMYVAFGFIIVGAVVRFLDPDRWLRIVLASGPEGAELRVWGAERYTAGAPRESRRLMRLLGEPSFDRPEIEETGDDS